MPAHPNPDLEIFTYELPELLNNVIAGALFRHCEHSGRTKSSAANSSAANQSKTRLLRYARNDEILEFINIL